MKKRDSSDRDGQNGAMVARALVDVLAKAVLRLRAQPFLYLVAVLVLAVILFLLRAQLATELRLFILAFAVLGLVAYLSMVYLRHRGTARAEELRVNLFRDGEPLDRAKVTVVGLDGCWETSSTGLVRIAVPQVERRESYELVIRHGEMTDHVAVGQGGPLRVDLPIVPGPSPQRPQGTAPPPEARTRLWLKEHGSPSNPLEFETTEDVANIGRADDNDLVLSDSDVSWHHGFIKLITDEYHFYHTSETNPTVVRRHGQEHVLSSDGTRNLALRNYDRIVIGKTVLVFQCDIAAGSKGYMTTEPHGPSTDRLDGDAPSRT